MRSTQCSAAAMSSSLAPVFRFWLDGFSADVTVRTHSSQFVSRVLSAVLTSHICWTFGACDCAIIALAVSVPKNRTLSMLLDHEVNARADPWTKTKTSAFKS